MFAKMTVNNPFDPNLSFIYPLAVHFLFNQLVKAFYVGHIPMNFPIRA